MQTRMWNAMDDQSDECRSSGPGSKTTAQECTVLVHSFQIAKLIYKIVRKGTGKNGIKQKKEKDPSKNKRVYRESYGRFP